MLFIFAACTTASDIYIEPDPIPTSAPPNTVFNGPIEAFAAGREASFILRPDGTLWAWGWNSYGQVGNGQVDYLQTDSGHMTNPNPTMIMENVAHVSAGDGHVLAMTTDGRLWAWGNNNSGQLGDGTQDNRFFPVLIVE
ncbi:MAG: hypothetical protein FWC93_00155 [Defluviitaleaceae bacterium]|nr:hypothetical protein [Defluviitaleaceae bacterium]